MIAPLRPYGKRSAFARRVADIELLYPRDAVPILVQTTGAAWNWTAYSQLVASTSADFWPVAFHLNVIGAPQAAGIARVFAEIELATGAAGSEVPFATIPYAFDANIGTSTPGTDLLGTGFEWPLPPAKINSGTRIAMRSRISVADTVMKLYAAGYLAGYEGAAPSSDLRYPLDQHLRGDFPSELKQTPAGSSLSVPTTGFPTFGAWTEVIASAAADLLVWGIAYTEDASGTNSSRKVQLGIGASGSEVAYTQVGFPHAVTVLGSGVQRLRRPLLVYSGERLAVRQSGGGNTSQMKFMYEEL